MLGMSAAVEPVVASHEPSNTATEWTTCHPYQPRLPLQLIRCRPPCLRNCWRRLPTRSAKRHASGQTAQRTR